MRNLSLLFMFTLLFSLLACSPSMHRHTLSFLDPDGVVEKVVIVSQNEAGKTYVFDKPASFELPDGPYSINATCSNGSDSYGSFFKLDNDSTILVNATSACSIIESSKTKLLEEAIKERDGRLN